MKYLYTNIKWKINKEYNLNKLLYLMVDRPDVIDVNNYFNFFTWKNNKKNIHRNYDLPSYVIISTGGEKHCLYWYINNILYKKNILDIIVLNE